MSHSFLIEDLPSFLASLEARRYSHRRSDLWTVYSKDLSGALIRHYGFSSREHVGEPVKIRVSYDFIKGGKPLEALVRRLKELNRRYRRSLPGWKTRREPAAQVRQRRWVELQRFFHRHGELISCFKAGGDERLTEGNYMFNLHVASTPAQQRLCLEFIKSLAEAETPHGIIRGRRSADKPVQQRNGWIKRYTLYHKKRGWMPREIVREIQKELRNGTWNERAKLQYNIAENTICKIAGIKISRPGMRHHLLH